MTSAIAVSLSRPWLRFDLDAPMQVLSWSLNKPGFVTAQRIIWREVRNADLPQDLDVHAWFDAELRQEGEAESVAFLTSRNIDRFRVSDATIDDVTTKVVATVGLSNAERIGAREPVRPLNFGTINIAAQVNLGLSNTGLIEALSIVVQARTAAVIDAGVPLSAGIATGTGTDCVAVAAPVGDNNFAGLHTDIGEALGRAVYDAVHAGARDWIGEQDMSHS